MQILYSYMSKSSLVGVSQLYIYINDIIGKSQ